MSEQFSRSRRARRARDLGNQPVRIVKGSNGTRIYIGDNEFEHPISRGSVSVAPGPSKRMNLLTLTLVVGNVSVENAEPMGPGDSVAGEDDADRRTVINVHQTPQDWPPAAGPYADLEEKR